MSLDTLALRGGIPPHDFVKIDVEGAEAAVLWGMHQTLRRGRALCIVETHGLTLEQDCVAYLTTVGYQTRVIRNAWWRMLYPEYGPTGYNRWLFARPVET